MDLLYSYCWHPTYHFKLQLGIEQVEEDYFDKVKIENFHPILRLSAVDNAELLQHKTGKYIKKANEFEGSELWERLDLTLKFVNDVCNQLEDLVNNYTYI